MANFAVQTSNKFAFLDEDASESAPPQKQEKKEKEVKKKQEPRKETKPRESNKDRPPRNGAGEGRNNRGKGGRTRGGGGGGRGGKREFDRHSGSGRRDTQRKGGAGGHNWGVQGDQEERKPAAEEKAEATEAPAEDAAPAAEAGEGEAAEAADAEPAEPEQITYDEMLARRAAAALDVDNRKARKVDNDDSLFKVAGEKAADNEEADLESQYELGVGGKSKTGKGKKGKKEKGTVNIDQFMSNAPKKGAQRGGRRGDMGSRKGGRGKKITIDDKNFPKLG